MTNKIKWEEHYDDLLFDFIQFRSEHPNGNLSDSIKDFKSYMTKEEQQKVSHIDYSSVPEGKLKESETPKPSKDMMDMIREHTDRTCDMVIDQCIKVVSKRLVGGGIYSLVIESIITEIIEELNNLKNKDNG